MKVCLPPDEGPHIQVTLDGMVVAEGMGYSRFGNKSVDFAGQNEIQDVTLLVSRSVNKLSETVRLHQTKKGYSCTV